MVGFVRRSRGLAPGDDYTLDINGLDNDGEAGIRVQYRDLAGQRFATEFRVQTWRTGIKVQGLRIADGYWDPEIPRPSMGDPSMAVLPRFRERLTAAAETLWPPVYVDPVQPFWLRFRVALAAMRVPTSTTLSQRIHYGVARGFREVRNTEVPWHLPR